VRDWKIVTRRVFTGKPGFHIATDPKGFLILDRNGRFEKIRSPYGGAGDILWVREPYEKDGRTIPALFMPKAKARIFLWVCHVTISTLGQMTGADAYDEGCLTLAEYIDLWNEINAPRGFPWKNSQPVWEIRFNYISHSMKDWRRYRAY
jgi:hypothetical protein